MAQTSAVEVDSSVADQGVRQPTASSRLDGTRRELKGVKLALARVAVLLGFLAAWELAAGRVIDPFFSSSPSLTITRLVNWIGSGYIVPHLWASLVEMTLGLVIGTVLGVVTGFALGRMPRTADVLNPFITALYSLPKLALAPLLILWFGIGLLSKVVMVVLLVYFFLFYNTYAGVREVQKIHLDAVALMGADRQQTYRKVILPSATIWIMTGMKLALPYGLVGAVVAEMISSNQGIGFLIINSASLFDTSGVMASLVIIGFISAGLNFSVEAAERRLLRWKR